MLVESILNCSVYHICRLKDKFNYEKGYIGVSCYVQERWGAHKRGETNRHLKNALNKYDDVIFYVILRAGEDFCYVYEHNLRREKNIGWNIAIGGSKPPSPKGLARCIGNLPKHLRRKNFKHTQETKDRLSKYQQENKEHFSKIKRGRNNPQYRSYGEKNPNFKGYCITPDGIFDSLSQAGRYYGVARDTITNILSKTDSIRRCRTLKEYCQVGKTWKELGWTFITKEEIMDKNSIGELFGWKLPRVYQFNDSDHLHELVESLPNLEEGFVMFNPDCVPVVKIKSSMYLCCHRLRGEGLTANRIAEMVVSNEYDEYLAIFKEDSTFFKAYITEWYRLRGALQNLWAIHGGIEDKKEFALAVKDTPFSAVLFSFRNNNDTNIINTLNSSKTSYKVKLLLSQKEYQND